MNSRETVPLLHPSGCVPRAPRPRQMDRCCLLLWEKLRERCPHPETCLQDQTVRGRIGAASGKPGAWSRLSVVVSPEPAASFGTQVGRNSLSEELARQHGTAGRSAGLGGVASRSGEQGRGQGEGDGAVPSRIGEEGLFVGGENPFGKGGRGQGRRERLETVMARQKVVLCGLVQALRALDLLHFLVPEQEARFGQLNGLPRQQ